MAKVTTNGDKGTDMLVLEDSSSEVASRTSLNNAIALQKKQEEEEMRLVKEKEEQDELLECIVID